MSNQLEEVSKVEEKSMQQESIKPVALKYGCEVLQEKTTHQVANDKSLPNDAYLITYIVNGETHMDLTRCKSQVSLFDMYYDTYGAGAVQSIKYGYGTSNPKLWGNSKKTETKKRK
jgi:hypothetical protein